MNTIAKVTLLCCLCLSLLSVAGCNADVQPPRTGWYHWQQRWAPSDSLLAWADPEGEALWYVRFFDIDTPEGAATPVPVSRLEWGRPLPDTLVAAVFITTRALEAVPADSLHGLARKTWQLMRQMARAAGVHLAEVQMDCDWTSSLRDRYFSFLSAFRQMLPAGCVLSATIRLHQIKWAERTGVPPVDRGMLMLYNTGRVQDPAERNSILETEVLRQYLTGFDTYPLPLDVVWPVFGWGVVFREGRFVRLIHPLSRADLTDTARFAQADHLHFAVRQSTWLNGHYLYAGDTIRLENVPFDTLLVAARLLQQAMPRPPARVAFYHLYELVPQNWTHEQLRRIVEAMAH